MPLGSRNIEPVYLGAHSVDPDEDKSLVSVTVANNSIVGALLQLSSLVRHADDLFCDISEECQLVVDRTDKLNSKICDLNKAASNLDAKRAQVPEGDLKKFSSISEHHRARHGYDEHLFLPTNRPQCIHDQYNTCPPNPGRLIRSVDLYRKDGLSGSKMFKCWPVLYNDKAVRTPDLSLPRRVQRVRSFERKYKKLRERPKTIHGWDHFKLDDVKKEEKEEEPIVQSDPVVISIDTSGSNFERMQSLRLSGRRYQNKAEREKKKKRRRTVTGVPESIMHEIEKFDRHMRHQGGGPRKTPRSYSFDDLDAEDDLERDEGIVKYLDEIDGKMEERIGEEKAQKLMKFFPCRRSKSLPRCIKLGSVGRSLSSERNRSSSRDVDRDLNTTYGSSSLSLSSAVSSASSRLSRATRRSSALGNKLKSLVSGNVKDKPARPRPKSLDIDTFLDSDKKGNSIKSQERSKSTYSLERNKEARSVPDNLLHKDFSLEGSSTTVGPGSYYNFESSTLPRAQQKKYDFPWESLPKDWTTSVKLREISKRRAREDRQSSSGNWSQSGTSSNRHSLDSDLRGDAVKFNSQYSLGKDSGRDSLTLEGDNDGGTDTTSTAGYAADGTSTIVGSSDSLSIGNPKSDFSELETEQWLQSLAARAAKQEGITEDGSLSLSRLTRKNILALDLILTKDTVKKRGDEESSVYSVDQEGFYTSFHNDSGLKKSTNTLVDEEDCSPTKDSNSVCSVDSVIFRPQVSDKYANLKKGSSANKVLSKVTPPTAPQLSTSDTVISEESNNSGPPELLSFSSQDSSVSSSDTEAVFTRVHEKTVLSSTGFPSLTALSTSDDESSPDSFNLNKKGRVRKGDNYIFDETEGEISDSIFKVDSKFSLGNQDKNSYLTTSRSESNFLQYVDGNVDKTSVLNEQETNPKDNKSVSYQSWPRTHKSSTPLGILKTPEKQFDNRPQKTLNFAPMVNLFNPGTQNSVQMPLPSPTNSSSSESNVNSFGVFNGSPFQAIPDKKYQLIVPEHNNSNLKKKVGSPEVLPLKYQPVITVTPRSRSGDRKGSDRERSRRSQMQPSHPSGKSPMYPSSHENPKAQSTPHSSVPKSRSSRSQSLYAVSPVLNTRDTKRQVSNTSTASSNSDYMDMQSVGSLQSADSISSLGSAEGISFGDNSTYMTMTSPCSSPNLSNMDFSISSTPSGSVDSLLDLRKTPTNELENDTYRINTNLHMNQAYSHQNGRRSSNGVDKQRSQTYNGKPQNGSSSHRVNSANSSSNSFKTGISRNASVTSDNRSLNTSSSDNDLTRVTQLSMNSSRGSQGSLGSQGSQGSLNSSQGSLTGSNQREGSGYSNQRQTGRSKHLDTRHEPSYRSHNASNRRSLPSDMSSVNVYKQKVPLNDTKGKSYTPPNSSSQMSSSKSYPSGFNNMSSQPKVNGQSVSGPRSSTGSRTSPSNPPGNKDSFRTDSYRVAMDTCGDNTRNGSYRVAMHPSKSFPLLPPTTQSGPYRVAMDMSPKGSLNNSYSHDNDDVMSRADSYRIAVRNTNGIVSQDMTSRNTSYRVAVNDDVPSVVNAKFDAMNLDSKKKLVSGRDIRRMGITDVDQAKDISVSKTMSNGKVPQAQSQSSSRIRKVTDQDLNPIHIVQTVDNNNDTKKSQKNNQNRSSTYIQFDPIFEDDDFGNMADALQVMAKKSEGADLSFKDYSASVSNASKAKFGKISGGTKDANSNDIKSATKRGGKAAHINSGIEVEDNWRFSQV